MTVSYSPLNFELPVHGHLVDSNDNLLLQVTAQLEHIVVLGTRAVVALQVVLQKLQGHTEQELAVFSHAARLRYGGGRIRDCAKGSQEVLQDSLNLEGKIEELSN